MPILMAGLLFGNSLLATDADSEEKPKPRLKVAGGATVTITAEAHAVEVAKTPNPVVVIDAEKLVKSGAASLGKALDQALPGRSVAYGSAGSAASIFINGSRSQDAVVLLDGIKVSDVNLGVDLSQFALSGVGRVEILLGPASTLYGSDAHGGVISLSSLGQASIGFSGLALQTISSLGQARAGATASYGWDRGWMQGTVEGERSPQATETERPFRQASGHIGLGWMIGKDWLFTINHRGNYKGIPLPFSWDYDENGLPSRKYAHSREAALWQNITTASIKSGFSDELFGVMNFGSISQENYYNDTQYSANLRRYQCNAMLTLRQPKGSASLLADLSSEKFWNEDPGRASKGQHSALAIEGILEASSILRFVASVREQRDLLEQFGQPDTRLNQTTWKVGANLLMPSGFRVYINSGTAFNAPSLFALGWNAYLGKSAPGNERSRSALGGVGYECEGWGLRVDASRINYNGLVDFVGGWADGYFANKKRARIQGLELAGGLRRDGWALEAFARTQEGRDLSLPPERQFEGFLSRPFFSAGLRGSWTFKALDMGLDASYVGHRYVYSSDIGGMAAEKNHYIDASAFAIFRLAKSVDIALRAERIFQNGISRDGWERGLDIGRNNMALLPGYPSPGRAVSLEARYRF
jgi:vitamin B12 transporter